MGTGFAINLIKSVMTPSQEMEFLSTVNQKLTISLPEEKLQKVTMSRFVSEPTSINLIINEGLRTSYVNNLGCPSNLTEQSFPPATPDSILERKEVLLANIIKQLKTRASMRDKKFGYVQWDFSSQTGSTKCVPDRCFIGLLGCSSPGTINRKNRSFQERKWHINKLELLAVKLAH